MSDPALQKKPAITPAPSNIAPEIYQRAASDPESSVWVGASAGSGKTTVLTSRVMRLLLDGVSPQKILCLTFTRAAAAEMAIRVMGRLSLWATCSDEKLGEDLGELQGVPPQKHQLKLARRLFAEVLSCPGGMRIRTIHAFCQEILGRFPIEAGLPPHFAVIDEADAEKLMQNVQQEFLRELQNAPDHALAASFQHLVYDLGEKNFVLAMAKILRERARLDDAIRNAGSLEELIVQMQGFLELAPGEKEQDILRAALDFNVLPHAEIKHAATRMLAGRKTVHERGENILRWLDLPPEARAGAFESYWRCFLKTDATPFARFGDSDLLKTHPDLETVTSREAIRLTGVLERLETARIAATTEAVLRVGRELARRMSERKAVQAALDYEDLINHANRLLHRPGIAPWVLYKLDGGLDHILVDEAQDTSRAQWSVIRALADEFLGGASARGETNRTVFVVGDEKQSIFSFQNADPEAFADMRNYFAKRLNEIGDELRLIPLHISFRSAPAILNAVDKVFEAEDTLAGVASQPIHHSAARPRKGEPEKIGRVEVWPLQPAAEKESPGDGDWALPPEYEDEIDPQTDLAALISTTIRQWLGNRECLAGTEVPIRPRDIMILLRNRGRFADLMVRALKQRDVPVTGVDKMKLTEQLSVMDLLALIQFALLPEDDLNLATVLRGPFLNCSEEQLMALAIGRAGSLWQSLTSMAQKDAAFAPFADYLNRWLKEADFVTPFALLARILNEPCPGSETSGRYALWVRLGPDALDPVEELLNAAQNFGMRHPPSLQAFLQRILASEASIKRELDHGGGHAGEGQAGGGQVRIMTVHGSKGLEAPIVFLPDASTLPRAQDVPKFLWSKTAIPLYLSRKPETGPGLHLWSEARQKQMEEYRRLLYVALTRAARRLYIGGWEKAKKKADKPSDKEPAEKTGEKSWYDLARTALESMDSRADVMTDQKPEPVICWADPVTQTIPEPKALSEAAAIKITLPAWARQRAGDETGLLDILSPSRMEASATATPDSAFSRGRIIHRLLQSLPEVSEARRADVAARFLANPRHDLTPEQQKEIQTEVMGLFQRPDYAPLFGAGSRAEVPLTGQVDGHIIAGQVDRLCLREHEVWIVDYKTSRPPPADAAGVSLDYRRQLGAYRAALQDIYPGKAVRCFLLWTYKPQLMELPPEALIY